MEIIEETTGAHYDTVLIKFTESALAGSAAAIAGRHDFSAEKFAKIAVQIAKAAVEELKLNG